MSDKGAARGKAQPAGPPSADDRAAGRDRHRARSSPTTRRKIRARFIAWSDEGLRPHPDDRRDGSRNWSAGSDKRPRAENGLPRSHARPARKDADGHAQPHPRHPRLDAHRQPPGSEKAVREKLAAILPPSARIDILKGVSAARGRQKICTIWKRQPERQRRGFLTALPLAYHRHPSRPRSSATTTTYYNIEAPVRRVKGHRRRPVPFGEVYEDGQLQSLDTVYLVRKNDHRATQGDDTLPRTQRHLYLDFDWKTTKIHEASTTSSARTFSPRRLALITPMSTYQMKQLQNAARPSSRSSASSAPTS